MNRATKILYVEDDSSSVMLVRRALGNEGYQITTASDGLSAIEVARRHTPDLILMDINIDGLDGYEVTTRLRATEGLEQVPIVAVTAATLKGDRERALIAGCTGYIPKPIDVDRFPDQVRSFLNGTREEIESAEKKAEYLVEYSYRLVNRLEEKLRELERAHRELQRMDKTKTDFIILASHELRTPLTAIYGYSQILQSECSVPGSPNEAGSPRAIVERITEASHRLNRVVGDILNVSLIDAGKLDLAKEPVLLNCLIREAVQSVTDAAPDREIAFEIKGLKNLPPVTGDSKRLYQALWNVISNAVKYTPDGEQIRIVGQQTENEVHIAIHDSGVGIPPEDQERIFDRFYVLENTNLHYSSKTAFKGGGLGVGLTVARGIIEAHGGRIWAESEGRDEEQLPGSTFHIVLPLRASCQRPGASVNNTTDLAGRASGDLDPDRPRSTSAASADNAIPMTHRASAETV